MKNGCCTKKYFLGLLKRATSQFLHLEKVLPKVFKLVVCNPFVIFSILNHPCYFMVKFYLFGVFLS